MCVLTEGQKQGLMTTIQRYKSHQPFTCIAGMAGTGKTFLIQYIVEALGIPEKDVAYVSYTGKAATVLKKNGCKTATTAHKLLYNSYPKKDGTFYHIPKKPLDYPYKLIVVDEVSMLPREMWELLLSHHIHVLACGDPMQLPPIGEDNGVLANPHVFLTEIMRQEEDNEIIRLTLDIRQGKTLQPFKGKNVQVLEKKDFVTGMLTWADQVIVGKNITRHQINDLMRKMKYGDDVPKYPINGERVINLKNDWDHPNIDGDFLVNGSIGTLTNVNILNGLRYINDAVAADFTFDFSPEGRTDYRDLLLDYKLFCNWEPTVNKDNFKKIPIGIRPKEMDYAYCITGHKSQGSQYPKVLVLEETLQCVDHIKWLYTVCTRPEEKLVIIKSYDGV